MDDPHRQNPSADTIAHTGSAHTGPALTVIVPMHDVAPYLDECLASLSAQTFTDFEALLIDDGSTDETVEIARRHDDPRFRIVQQDHLGLSAARNRGLDEARGEYVGFLDADDVLPRDAYELLLGTIRHSGSDFIAGAYVRLRPADDGTRYELGIVQPWVEDANRRLIGTTLAEHPEAVANIVAWSKLSRRAFWDEHDFRFPVGELYEDQVLAARFYACARAFDMIPEVVYHWRIRAEGTSITQRERELATLAACLRAMTGMLDALDDSGHHHAAQVRLRHNLQRDLPRLVQAADGQDEHLALLAATVAAALARATDDTLSAVPGTDLAELLSLAAREATRRLTVAEPVPLD
ncbi:glycosyltransferase family 2 protein [Plantibacter sp. YIM 135347]|uniref:glycosyltransferase family 2 protein n=1 Tax=Plantibacter sp. YIM 135347 TaxID=3423919 RepID=UPI003D35984E